MSATAKPSTATRHSAGSSTVQRRSLAVLSGGRELGRRMRRAAVAGSAITTIVGLFSLGHMHGVVLESHAVVAENRDLTRAVRGELDALEVTIAELAGPERVRAQAVGLGLVEVTSLVVVPTATPDEVATGANRLLLQPVILDAYAPETSAALGDEGAVSASRGTEDSLVGGFSVDGVSIGGVSDSAKSDADGGVAR